MSLQGKGMTYLEGLYNALSGGKMKTTPDLPTGAATSAAQATGNASLESIKTDVDKIPPQGQAARSASMPVAISTEDNAALVRPGVKAFKFLQSFSRADNATPYSPGDVVNDSAATPHILTQDLSSFGAVLGQFICITNVQVVASIKNTTMNLSAYIFNQTFTATADNLELSIDDATAKSGGHVIAISNNFSTALNTKLQSDPGQYVMQLAATGTPSLFAALQTPSGYTPSNLAEYTLIIDGYLL